MPAKIKYNGNIIASLENGQTATLKCKDLPMGGDVEVTVDPSAVTEDSAKPVEVATEAEMTAILENATADSIGEVYKYTGTTGTYENGALYIVEVAE